VLLVARLLGPYQGVVEMLIADLANDGIEAIASFDLQDLNFSLDLSEEERESISDAHSYSLSAGHELGKYLVG
jgi:hypothetical protein